MPKSPALIREFATEGKVDTSPWTVTETSTHIITAANIPNRIQADQLTAFLAGQGLVVTLSMGDKTGTTWNVRARPTTGQAAAPAGKRRRSHHLGLRSRR